MALGNPITLTGNVSQNTLVVVATAGQTLFTVTGGYIVNKLAVFRNGVRLSQDRDYTAADGATVTLSNAAALNDTVTFQIFEEFAVADAIVGSASTQTINGNLTVRGDLNYTGSSTGIVTTLIQGDNIELSGSVGAVTITGLARTDVIVSERVLVSGVTTSTGGFVGNLTGNVVGNVTGNTSGTAGGLTGTPDITVGSITAATAAFSGSISVGGTLTYEDVNNVDSVGLVTARTGVIASGLGVSVTSGGITGPSLSVTGIVTASSYVGDGSALTLDYQDLTIRNWIFGCG